MKCRNCGRAIHFGRWLQSDTWIHDEPVGERCYFVYCYADVSTFEVATPAEEKP